MVFNLARIESTAPYSHMQGLRYATLWDVLWSLVHTIILLPLSVLSYLSNSTGAPLNDRAVFVNEHPVKQGQSLPLRNARGAQLVCGAEGASLRTLWQRTVEKHGLRPAMHIRPLVRDIKQVEVCCQASSLVGFARILI
jgi:hypothetical protein